MSSQAEKNDPKQLGDDQPKLLEGGDAEYADTPMTLWEHLAELRKRMIFCLIALLIGAIVAWEYRETLLTFLVTPFADAWRAEKLPGEPMLHFQTPAAAFFAYFKISLLGAAVAGAPVIFYQIWAFVAPGLYKREKRYVIPFVFSSTVLFVGGGYFGWRAAFPLAFRYLLGLSGTLDTINVQVAPTVMMGDYISFVTRMLLGFGLIFEIPLFIFFLAIAGIVNYLHLIQYGRWFVVGAFVAAAIITPPDITSQVMMAVPMMVLYGGSIFLAMIFGKKPTEAQREAFRGRKKKKKLDEDPAEEEPDKEDSS